MLGYNNIGQHDKRYHNNNNLQYNYKNRRVKQIRPYYLPLTKIDRSYLITFSADDRRRVERLH